jgi:hypothetical protein
MIYTIKYKIPEISFSLSDLDKGIYTLTASTELNKEVFSSKFITN